jgi:signal transduction histidine kinase
VQILGTPDLVEALMCAPLISRGQLTGVMALTRVGEHPPFRPADLDFLIALAGQAAIAIENARLYEREQQRAAELAQALAQQQELDRLKNQFVQNISHELRTPLAIVRGYAELLESGELGKLQTGQLEPVNVMARRTRMLSKMLDDLIVILSVEAQTSAREPIDLRELVELTLADFEAAIQQAQLQLDIDLVDGPLPIVGDSNQLRRVIDNLLANAQKFTPGGGRVAIRLTRDHTEALLEVADSGIGIPDDQLNRIFERFYQVDGSPTRRYGGVGLGLALVKEIVEAHDGRVAVESVLGKGSSFRIWLPMNGPVIDQVDKATS